MAIGRLRFGTPRLWDGGPCGARFLCGRGPLWLARGCGAFLGLGCKVLLVVGGVVSVGEL